MNAVDAILAVYLAAAAIIDILHKKIKYRMLICGVIPVAASLIRLLTEHEDEKTVRYGLILMAAGLALGFVFLIIAVATGERLGKGDAVIFCICGATVGIESLIAVIMTAFLLSAVYSAAMLAAGRLRKHSRIAFIPFIFLGYAMSLIAGLCGG